MKRTNRIIIALSLLAGYGPATAATIAFSVANFNNTSQLSTIGLLVDAAHFGADAEADVTVGSTTFVSRGGSSPTLVIGGTAGAAFHSASFYQSSTHATGYTSITGLSLTDVDLMFDSVAYGPGAGNSLVTLSGLTEGNEYSFKLLLVKSSPVPARMPFHSCFSPTCEVIVRW